MKNLNKNVAAVLIVVAIFAALALVSGIVMKFLPAGVDLPQPDSSQSQSQTPSDSQQDSTSSSEESQSAQDPFVVQPVTGQEYKAMWISYLEYQNMDLTSKAAFVKDITEMFKNCVDLGLNTVIVQVRPFGDALYPSKIFPTSHLINGTQGAPLTYDPLQEMIDIAHGMNLRLEAWVNPYRVRSSSKAPGNLAQSNPANDTSLVFSVDGGIYYNPALTSVQDLVVSGIEEIITSYKVDGIHLDDYFYPTTDLSIDKADYDASGSALSQADWRRQNVNTLVAKIYDKIKSIDKNITFGISPQGNNDNNYNMQYSDVNLWLSQPGYVDYIMPQLYWGFNYLTKSQRTDFQFINLTKQWASYPRHENVKLYLGLGAYRIGDGDGGNNDQSEWSSGTNLAKMVEEMRTIEGVSGFALYRYDNLYRNSLYQKMVDSEIANLKSVLK